MKTKEKLINIPSTPTEVIEIIKSTPGFVSSVAYQTIVQMAGKNSVLLDAVIDLLITYRNALVVCEYVDETNKKRLK